MPRPWPCTPTWTIPWGGGGSRPEDGTIYCISYILICIISLYSHFGSSCLDNLSTRAVTLQWGQLRLSRLSFLNRVGRPVAVYLGYNVNGVGAHYPTGNLPPLTTFRGRSGWPKARKRDAQVFV